jgi:hypothetical protein
VILPQIVVACFVVLCFDLTDLLGNLMNISLLIIDGYFGCVLPCLVVTRVPCFDSVCVDFGQWPCVVFWGCFSLVAVEPVCVFGFVVKSIFAFSPVPLIG